MYFSVIPSNYLECCKVRKVVLDMSDSIIDKENFGTCVFQKFPRKKKKLPIRKIAQESSIEFPPILIENLNTTMKKVNDTKKDGESLIKQNEDIIIESDEHNGSVLVKLVSQNDPPISPKQLENQTCTPEKIFNQIYLSPPKQNSAKPQLVFIKQATLDGPILKRDESFIPIQNADSNHYSVTSSLNQKPIMSTGLTKISVFDVRPSLKKFKSIAPKITSTTTNIVTNSTFLVPKKRLRTATINVKKCKTESRLSSTAEILPTTLASSAVSSSVSEVFKVPNTSVKSSELDSDINSIMNLSDDIPCIMSDNLENTALEQGKIEAMLQSINEGECTLPTETLCVSQKGKPLVENAMDRSKESEIARKTHNECLISKNNLLPQPSDHCVTVSSSNYSIMSLCMPSKTVEGSNSSSCIQDKENVASDTVSKPSTTAEEPNIKDSKTTTASGPVTSSSVDNLKAFDMHLPLDCRTTAQSALTFSLIHPPTFLNTLPYLAPPPVPPFGFSTLTLSPLPVTQLPSTILSLQQTTASGTCKEGSAGSSFLLASPPLKSTLKEMDKSIVSSSANDKENSLKIKSSTVSSSSLIETSTKDSNLTPSKSLKLSLQLPLISSMSSSEASNLEPVGSKAIFSLAPITSYAHPFSFCALPLSDAPTTFSFTLTKNPPNTVACTTTTRLNEINTICNTKSSTVNKEEVTKNFNEKSISTETVFPSVSTKKLSLKDASSNSPSICAPVLPNANATTKCLTSNSTTCLPVSVSTSNITISCLTTSTSNSCLFSRPISDSSRANSATQTRIMEDLPVAASSKVCDFKLPLLPLSSYLSENCASANSSTFVEGQKQTVNDSGKNSISNISPVKANCSESKNKEVVLTQSNDCIVNSTAVSSTASPLCSISRMFSHVKVMDKLDQNSTSSNCSQLNKIPISAGTFFSQERPIDFTAQSIKPKSSDKSLSSHKTTNTHTLEEKNAESGTNDYNIKSLQLAKSSLKEACTKSPLLKSSENHEKNASYNTQLELEERNKTINKLKCPNEPENFKEKNSSTTSNVTTPKNLKFTASSSNMAAVASASGASIVTNKNQSTEGSNKALNNSSASKNAVSAAFENKTTKSTVTTYSNCQQKTALTTVQVSSAKITPVCTQSCKSPKGSDLHNLKPHNPNANCAAIKVLDQHQESLHSLTQPCNVFSKHTESNLQPTQLVSTSVQSSVLKQCAQPVLTAIPPINMTNEFQQQQRIASAMKTSQMSQLNQGQQKQMQQNGSQTVHHYSADQKTQAHTSNLNITNSKDSSSQMPNTLMQQPNNTGQQLQMQQPTHRQAHISMQLSNTQQNNSTHHHGQSSSQLQSLNNFESTMVDGNTERGSDKVGHNVLLHQSPMSSSGYEQSFDYNPYYNKKNLSPRGESRHHCYAYKHTPNFQQDVLAEGGPTASNPIMSPMYMDSNEDLPMRDSEEQASDHVRGFSVSHLVSAYNDSRKPSHTNLKETVEDKHKDSAKKSLRKDSKSRALGSNLAKNGSHSNDARRRSPARSMSHHQNSAVAMWNSSKASNQKQYHNYSAEALISTQNYSRNSQRQSSNQNYHFMSHNQMYQGPYAAQQMRNLVQNPSFGYPGPDRTGFCNPDYNLQLHSQTSAPLHYTPNVPYMSYSSYQNIPQSSSNQLPSDLMSSSHSAPYSRLHDINDHSNFPPNASFPLPLDSQDMYGSASVTSGHVRMTRNDASISLSSYSKANSTKASNMSSNNSGNPTEKRPRYSDAMIAPEMMTSTNFLEGTALSHISLHSFTPPCEDQTIMHSNFFAGTPRTQNNFLLAADNFGAQYSSSNSNSGYPTIGGSINNPLSDNDTIGMGPGTKASAMPSHHMPPFNPIRQQMNMAPPVPAGSHLSSSLSNFNLTSIFPEIDGKVSNFSHFFNNNDNLSKFGSTQYRLST